VGHNRDVAHLRWQSLPDVRRRAFRVLAVSGLAAALTLTSACASTRTATGSGALSGQAPAVSPTPGATTTGSGTGGGSGGTGTTGTTGTGTTTRGSGGGSTTRPPAPSGPRIVSFVVTQQPSCPIVGTTDAPFSKPGTDIKLSWNVTGGVKRVALSLDSPGFFQQYGTGSIDTYAPQGSVDLSFQCDPTDQPNTTHKYTLDTIGGGTSVEKTITVTKQTSP
jgi:hypothetical protein